MVTNINNFGNSYTYMDKKNVQPPYEPLRQPISFQQKENTNNKQISLKEGLKLIGQGAKKQVKDIFKAIIEHPLKTAAVVGATTAGLFALPLVGIPTAVGGAAMAVGFAGLAAGKTLYHGAQFIKNNEDGTYDKARENLKSIGGDSVDLAMSAPFVPKALTEINKFTKYGQIGLNTEAITALKSAKGLGGKIKVIKDANHNLYRSMNYNQAAETELANLQGLSEAEKDTVRQYIREFNVSDEKIPEVVLEQWAKERGISTKPILKYESLKKTTMGYANPAECKIVINDFGKKNVKRINGNINSERYQQIGTRTSSNNKLEFTYRDRQTGQTFTQTIDSNLIKERNNLLNNYNRLSPQARRILTTTHEREHIDQFARFFANGEQMQLTPQARQLYQQMVSEMRPMTAREADYFRRMAQYKPIHRTNAAYVADPSEIAARAKEIELLKKQKFQTLDKVFKNTNNMAIDNGTASIVINGIRTQSATS